LLSATTLAAGLWVRSGKLGAGAPRSHTDRTSAAPHEQSGLSAPGPGAGGREPRTGRGPDVPAAPTAAPELASPRRSRLDLGALLAMSCAQLLPAAELGEHLGVAVAVERSYERDPAAHAICSVRREGTPPAPDERRDRTLANGGIPVPLSGDELCQIKVTCRSALDLEQERRRCERRRYRLGATIGALDCTGPAGLHPELVTVEPESRCRIEVVGGRYVSDIEVVKDCARGAVALVRRAPLTSEPQRLGAATGASTTPVAASRERSPATLTASVPATER
jgi:hypothetical protein